MICGVPRCNHSTKKYGVCGRHKQWAYTLDDSLFNNLLDTYEILMTQLVAETKRLQAIDIDVQDIRKYVNNYTINMNIAELPEHYKIAATLIGSMDKVLSNLNKLYDPLLVYNATMRARHQSGISGNCICKHCMLGSENKN